MVDILQAALEYEKMGYSVIPCNRKDKHPLIPWKKFQECRATTEEIKSFWEQYPLANVGIVTGEVSNLFIIDCDSESAYKMIQDYIPDSMIFPVVKTPRGGRHLWFSYPKESGLTIGAGVFPNLDFRGNGGFVVTVPSINGDGRFYEWIVKPTRQALDPLPDKLLALLSNNTNILFKHVVDKTSDNNRLQPSTTVYNMFQEGTRDQDLFHIANQLKRAGSSVEEISQVIKILAKNCNPPFPEKEAELKIKSVLERAEKKERPITQEIKDFIGQHSSTISLQNIYTHLQLSTREEKKAAWVALKRLEGVLIEKTGSIAGTYKILNQELERIDLKNKSDLTGELFIKFPLNIHEFIKVMPRCIYIIAGEPDSGKSGYLMSFAKKNSEKHKIHYFSSEMGKSEFLDRLQYFWPDAEDDLNMNFYERSEDFDQVIFPDDINIIDYMTLYDNFYLMAGLINAIGKKLKKGIVFIALQKPPGRDAALGGDRTKDLARLYLALSYQQMKIIKAKNWRNPKFNPNRLTINYEIWEGWDFKNTTPWQKELK